MSDPMQNLNDAADALNQVAARAAGFYDDADAEIAARQAAYDALAANLRAVVTSQMTFTATVDPTVVDPDNQDGGTFATIHEAIDAAPAGAYVNVLLPAGSVHDLSSTRKLAGKEVYISKTGAGDNPILNPVAYESGGHNYFHGFSPAVGGGVRFYQIDINLPAKANAGLPWSSLATLMRYSHGTRSFIGFFSCTVTGSGGVGLASAHVGTAAMLSSYGLTLDGDIFGVKTLYGGTAIILYLRQTERQPRQPRRAFDLEFQVGLNGALNRQLNARQITQEQKNALLQLYLSHTEKKFGELQRYMLFIPWLYRDLEKRDLPEAQLRTQPRQDDLLEYLQHIIGAGMDGSMLGDLQIRLEPRPAIMSDS